MQVQVHVRRRPAGGQASRGGGDAAAADRGRGYPRQVAGRAFEKVAGRSVDHGGGGSAAGDASGGKFGEAGTARRHLGTAATA